MIGISEFLARVATYSVGISYKAVKAEPDPTKALPSLAIAIAYTIQPNPSLDPAEEAATAQLASMMQPTFVLVPGRQFDATGTRHGKGAGWYDRFLSIVPSDWLRIGICAREQFSTETLTRESWDEPMDYVCVVEGTKIVSIYETRARSAILPS